MGSIQPINSNVKTYTIREIETGYELSVSWEDLYQTDSGDRYRYEHKTYAFATIGETLARLRGLVKKEEE